MIVASKKFKRNYCASLSALRRFIKQAIEIMSSMDPESVKLFTSKGWTVRQTQIWITRAFMPGIWSSCQEYRLNDAGFKIYFGVERDGKLRAYVGGDQTDCHPEAYIILTMLLHKEGLLPESRLDQVWPLSDDWFIQNASELKPEAHKWIRHNMNLLAESTTVLLAYAHPHFSLD